MRTGLYGATDIAFSRFRGVAEDTDPTEIGNERASAALNVDLADECIRKRLGKERWNGTVLGALADSPICGLHAYYPKDGSARVLLAANRTGLYADSGSGFSSIGTVTATEPLDILGFRDQVLFGGAHTGLSLWDGTGTAEQIANPFRPTLSDPTATEEVIEDFTDATGWSSTNADLTASDYVTGGANCMIMEAVSSAAVGAWIEKQWSAGATVDLSAHDSILFQFISGYQNAQFQFGVKKNDGTIVWLDLFAVTTAGKWETETVNLGPIDPADRDASTGFAIAFVQPLSGAGYPQSIVFSSAYLTAGFEADTYRYYATWYRSDRLWEGPPSEVASIRLAPGHKTASIDLQVPYSVDPDDTAVRIYRHRDNAEYANPRLVVEIPNDGVLVTYSDTRTDADLLISDAAEWTTQFLIDPPNAEGFALVGGRVLAWAVSIDGEYKPWAIYLSKWGFPNAFSTSQSPNDPLDAGWLELPERDNIVRILDVDGNAIIFCERSIWSLTGTGWDDFVLQKRADVGLSARWAIAVYGRLILFLAADGVRALDLAFGATPRFSTWVVSEPVAARLRAIPAGSRSGACMGIDERERLHLSYASITTTNDTAVILDLRQPGALTNKEDPTRPGWTVYDNWGFSVFLSLKRGGGDNGQLVGGSDIEGTVWRCQRDGSDLPILTDDGAAIAWSWTSACIDVGSGKRATLVRAFADLDAAPDQRVSLAVLLDRGRLTTAANLSLGSQGLGVVSLSQRLAEAGRYFQVRVSSSQSVAMVVRSLGLGVWPAKVR